MSVLSPDVGTEKGHESCRVLIFRSLIADFGILKWPTSAVCFGPPLDTANFYSGFERELGSGGWGWTGEARWSYSSRFGWSMSSG